jgi:hypothetical protein
MSKNLYKDYYEASSRGDEWSGVDAAKIREKIKKAEETASWNGRSVESVMEEMYNPWEGMGS